MTRLSAYMSCPSCSCPTQTLLWTNGDSTLHGYPTLPAGRALEQKTQEQHPLAWPRIHSASPRGSSMGLRLFTLVGTPASERPHRFSCSREKINAPSAPYVSGAATNDGTPMLAAIDTDNSYLMWASAASCTVKLIHRLHILRVAITKS